MNSTWLAQRICEFEGKKIQVNIAQAREIVKVMQFLVFAAPIETLAALCRVKPERVGTFIAIPFLTACRKKKRRKK